MRRSSLKSGLRLALKCELGQVRPAAVALHQFLLEQGCLEPEVRDCELALVEACNNAIQHATGAARQKPVLVEGEAGVDSIFLRVVDHTTGFAWPSRSGLPAAECETGRGLYLIRRIMDSAEYIRDGEANVLILVKKRLRGL